jgi:3-carboxy-cis,cis-muconate cycloisomerase
LSPDDRESDDAGGLFVSLFTTDVMARETSDAAWLQAFLDFEVALARAEAECGLFGSAVAEAIAEACEASAFEIADIGRDARLGGNPVIPLVAALRLKLSADDAAFVHYGATSQDVLDSALMLVSKRAIASMVVDLERAVVASAELAAAQRDTLQVARTLLQPALPTTFGLRAARWANALLDALERLEVVWSTLPVQLGGAAGTLAALGDQGEVVRRAVADELDLAVPPVPWQSDRQPVASLGSALALLTGVCGKIGRDVSLLSMVELAELREPAQPGRGSSSTLPQKCNPVLATLLLANARRAPALASILVSSLDVELERSPGAWHAEWLTVTELLQAAGGSAGCVAELLEGLEVDAAAMRAHVEAAAGSIMAEHVRIELGRRIGAPAAAEVVAAAAVAAADQGEKFDAALRREIDGRGENLQGFDLERALDPSSYLGSAGSFVDAVLERVAARASSRHRGHGDEFGRS